MPGQSQTEGGRGHRQSSPLIRPRRPAVQVVYRRAIALVLLLEARLARRGGSGLGLVTLGTELRLRRHETITAALEGAILDGLDSRYRERLHALHRRDLLRLDQYVRFVVRLLRLRVLPNGDVADDGRRP